MKWLVFILVCCNEHGGSLPFHHAPTDNSLSLLARPVEEYGNNRMVKASLCHIQKVARSTFVDYADASNPKVYFGRKLVDNVDLENVATDPLTGWILFDAAGRPHMEPGFEDQAAWPTVLCSANHENSLISVWSSSDATVHMQYEGKSTGMTLGPFTLWPSPSVIHETLHGEPLLTISFVADGPMVTPSSPISAVSDTLKASPVSTGTTLLCSPSTTPFSTLPAFHESVSSAVPLIPIPTNTSFATVIGLPRNSSIFVDIASISSSTVSSDLPNTTTATATQAPEYFLRLFAFDLTSGLGTSSTTSDPNTIISTESLTKFSDSTVPPPSENSFSLLEFKMPPGPTSSALPSAFPPSASFASSTGISPESSTVSSIELSYTEEASDTNTISTESATSSSMINDALLSLGFISGVSVLVTSSSLSISLRNSTNILTSNVTITTKVASITTPSIQSTTLMDTASIPVSSIYTVLIDSGKAFCSEHNLTINFESTSTNPDQAPGTSIFPVVYSVSAESTGNAETASISVSSVFPVPSSSEVCVLTNSTILFSSQDNFISSFESTSTSLDQAAITSASPSVYHDSAGSISSAEASQFANSLSSGCEATIFILPLQDPVPGAIPVPKCELSPEKSCPESPPSEDDTLYQSSTDTKSVPPVSYSGHSNYPGLDLGGEISQPRPPGEPLVVSLSPSELASSVPPQPSSHEPTIFHHGLKGGTKWDPITGEPIDSTDGHFPSFNPPVDYDPMSALKGNTQWNPVAGEPIKLSLDSCTDTDKFTKPTFDPLPEPSLSAFADDAGKFDLSSLKPVELSLVPEDFEDGASVSKNSLGTEPAGSSAHVPQAGSGRGRTALLPLTPVVPTTGVTLVDPFTGSTIIFASEPNHRRHALRNTISTIEARENTIYGPEPAPISPHPITTPTDLIMKTTDLNKREP